MGRKLRLEIYEDETDQPGRKFSVNAGQRSVSVDVSVPIREGVDLRDQAAKLCKTAMDLLETAGSRTCYGEARALPQLDGSAPAGITEQDSAGPVDDIKAFAG